MIKRANEKHIISLGFLPRVVAGQHRPRGQGHRWWPCWTWWRCFQTWRRSERVMSMLPEVVMVWLVFSLCNWASCSAWDAMAIETGILQVGMAKFKRQIIELDNMQWPKLHNSIVPAKPAGNQTFKGNMALLSGNSCFETNKYNAEFWEEYSLCNCSVTLLRRALLKLEMTLVCWD